MRALGRFAVILVSFISAILAASLFAVFLLVGSLGWTDFSPYDFEVPIYIFYFVVVGFFGFHSFFLAAIAIVLAEILRAKDWLYYAVSGGVVAALSALIAWRTGVDPSFYESDISLMFAFIGCGIVGGMTYWLFAGRTAGLWRKQI